MFGSSGQRALEGRLAQLIAGRSVLADEIANLDTPGYQAQGASSFAGQLQAALDQQLGGAPPQPASGAVPAVAVPLAAGTSPLIPLSAGSGTGALTPDGNGMNLDALMAQLGQTDLDYQAVARQLQLTYTNLSEAIDKGGA